MVWIISKPDLWILAERRFKIHLGRGIDLLKFAGTHDHKVMSDPCIADTDGREDLQSDSATKSKSIKASSFICLFICISNVL